MSDAQHKSGRDIVTALVEMIEAEKLGIGDRLPPEIELAKRFGVARSSIREVMSAWVRMGMVTRNKGAGTVLATEIAGRPIHMPLNLSLEVQSLSRMMEVRTPLEIEAARLAATAADTRARDAIMRSMLEQMDVYETGGDWRPADGAFHAEIHAATGNPLFGQIISTLQNAFVALYSAPFGEPQLGHATIPAHRDVAEAIVAGDGAKAAKIMEDILNETQRAVHEIVGGTGNE